jgi:hypothetical protein
MAPCNAIASALLGLHCILLVATGSLQLQAVLWELKQTRERHDLLQSTENCLQLRYATAFQQMIQACSKHHLFGV